MQSVGKQAAGREAGRGEWGGEGFLGRAQEPFPPAGMEQAVADMEVQERKGKFHRDKWLTY